MIQSTLLGWTSFAAGSLALLVAIAMTVIRALLGPTVFDRVLAANTVGTLAVGLMATYGFLTSRPEFLDIALTYALLNVLSTLAILKFFRFGSLGDPEDDKPDGREGKS
jgi:multicomponent Na+:H+ antiporter subunit F